MAAPPPARAWSGQDIKKGKKGLGDSTVTGFCEKLAGGKDTPMHIRLLAAEVHTRWKFLDSVSIMNALYWTVLKEKIEGEWKNLLTQVIIWDTEMMAFLESVKEQLLNAAVIYSVRAY